MLVSIICWALTVLGCLMGTRYYVHMLQLESYQLDGYMRWIKARGAHPVLINSCIGVGFAVMNICITALVRSHVPAVQGGAKVSVTAVFALVAFLMMRSWAAQSQKKPLAFTPRVKRLYWYLGGVCALLGAVLELLNVGCFMYSFVPMIVWAGAYAAQPGEQRINHSFFLDAQKKLAERPDLIKIGITGSYGKTSTKFVLKTLLEEKYNVLATPSSFNTPMGVTRIVREQLRPEHQIFIGEMGARHVGDIKEMCELVHPSIGVLTSIGPQHLETFGSIENVANTKNELVEALPADGMAFFAADGGWLDKLYARAACEKYRAGLTRDKMYMRAEDISVGPDGSTFTLVCEDGGRIRCTTRLLGKHNVQNIVLSAAVAHKLGVSMDQLASGIGKIEPIEHRLQLIPGAGGKVVIDDAFNSNPAGAARAMEVLASFDGLRCVVTPGMVELGAREEELNREFGRQMAKACDAAILLGKKRAQPIREGMIEVGFTEQNIFVVDSLDAAMPILAALNADVTLFENDLPDNYTE